MKRRDFVAGFGKAAGVAGSGAATLAAAGYPTARDAMVDAVGRLTGEMKKLDDRIEAMDKTQRSVIKALILVASMSTGLDAITWLKGDIV